MFYFSVKMFIVKSYHVICTVDGSRLLNFDTVYSEVSRYSKIWLERGDESEGLRPSLGNLLTTNCLPSSQHSKASTNQIFILLICAHNAEIPSFDLVNKFNSVVNIPNRKDVVYRNRTIGDHIINLAAASYTLL